jgi:hypothetical protein
MAIWQELISAAGMRASRQPKLMKPSAVVATHDADASLLLVTSDDLILGFLCSKTLLRCNRNRRLYRDIDCRSAQSRIVNQARLDRP